MKGDDNMHTDNTILAIFDEEYDLLAAEYQIEEITDVNQNTMSGGGGGGGGGR